MTQDANQHQAPIPRWMPQAPLSTDHQLLQRRIDELEEQIKAYELLLDELPELFERKFQQRLEPLMERYELLAQQLEAPSDDHDHPALPPSEVQSAGDRSNNVIGFPQFRLPKLPGFGQRRSA
jgi:hypothetical protein